MKRQHKLYSKPKRPFDKKRIDEEAKITEEFGLKNKKEIWRSEAKVNLIRKRAKEMIHLSSEEQKNFFDKLNKIGIKVNTISEVLSLDKEDILNRRLQTIVFKRKLANTIKAARQLIVHKNVFIDGKIINSPSYLVPIELENKIKLKETKLRKKEND